ncbi:MAG: 16S rRNA (guanine(527)-N(7))-methyltransferase RsmG [Elusimicrobiaceae bacterium]|nr:16S rRNA (guanine(527)-N(7))-methyltransferase RsmG [Elusimicrobiaceae bacterium]
MSKKLLDFAARIGLTLQPNQADALCQYAQLVWQKKNLLNLTSAADLEEVILRHICDGLQGASQACQFYPRETYSIMDAGAGAGYIGLTMAIALPQAQITLVESIEKRCAFMNWVLLKLGLKNARIKNLRLGEQKELQADLVTERAMGQLPDILGICAGAVKPGGIFMAYQGEKSQAATVSTEKYHLKFIQEISYSLPADTKTRHLAFFKKNV